MNIEDERQQRAGLFLRHVSYRIHAHFDLQPDAGENNTPAKFLDMFEPRAEKGQCINQPYLGCREFASDFRLGDVLVPMSMLPFMAGLGGPITVVGLLLGAVWMLYNSYQFLKDNSDNMARKVMFSSFVYLPLVLISMLIDKYI